MIPPFFDEGNRLRRTLVLTMTALAEIGFDSWLPDLPGQNDSLLPTEQAALSAWRAALTDLIVSSGRPVITAAWRSGALLDEATPVFARWRMAPQSGMPVLKTLARSRLASDQEAGHQVSMDGLMTQMRVRMTDLAGNRLSPAMVAELEAATLGNPPMTRTVTVGSGPDALPGSPLWLRAEPGEDREMAKLMAQDIAHWADTCASA